MTRPNVSRQFQDFSDHLADSVKNFVHGRVAHVGRRRYDFVLSVHVGRIGRVFRHVRSAESFSGASSADVRPFSAFFRLRTHRNFNANATQCFSSQNRRDATETDGFAGAVEFW